MPDLDTPTQELTSLDLRRLREANRERAEHWRNGAPPTPVDFDRIELAGEAGELLNEVKKLMSAVLGLLGEKPDTTGAQEELGDVVICADLLADKLGIDLAEAVRGKFDKTSDKHGFPVKLGSSETTPPEASGAAQSPERHGASGAELAEALEKLIRAQDFFEQVDHCEPDRDPKAVCQAIYERTIAMKRARKLIGMADPEDVILAHREAEGEWADDAVLDQD